MARNPDRDPFGPWLNGFSYEQAFNGKTWELHKGEDFDLAPTTVVKKIHEEYGRRFGELEVRADGDNVYIRLIPSK